MELIKNDWEELKKNGELNLKRALIDVMQFEKLIELCNAKIAEYPITESEKIIQELEGGN